MMTLTNRVFSSDFTFMFDEMFYDSQKDFPFCSISGVIEIIKIFISVGLSICLFGNFLFAMATPPNLTRSISDFSTDLYKVRQIKLVCRTILQIIFEYQSIF